MISRCFDQISTFARSPAQRTGSRRQTDSAGFARSAKYWARVLVSTHYLERVAARGAPTLCCTKCCVVRVTFVGLSGSLWSYRWLLPRARLSLVLLTPTVDGVAMHLLDLTLHLLLKQKHRDVHTGTLIAP